MPVRFDRETPAEDFWIDRLPRKLRVVDAVPGPCPGKVRETSICLENSGVTDIALERGDVVATVVSRYAGPNSSAVTAALGCETVASLAAAASRCSAPVPSTTRTGEVDRNKSASRVAAWGVFAFALLFVCADSAFKVDGGCAANKAASSASRSLRGTSGCPPQNPGHEDPAKYRKNSGLTGGEAVPAEPLGRSAEEVIKLTGGEAATADPPGSLMPSLQTLVSNATRQTQVEEETGQLLSLIHI